MSKILKNITGSPIVLRTIGLTVPVSSQMIINNQDYALLASVDSITEITPLINAGQIIVNDGVRDLTASNGINFLKHPDEAFNVVFKSDPQRSNGMASKNVQEAIEEVRNTAVGALLRFEFATSGNTADKWLQFSNGSSSSNQTPAILPQSMSLKGITFINQDDNVDTDIEIYKNGVLFYTESIRNKRWFYRTGITGLSNFSQGDRISVFLKRFNQGTGSSTAQNPLVSLVLKIVTETGNTGGNQNGV